jgi:hypothetical protein
MYHLISVSITYVGLLLRYVLFSISVMGWFFVCSSFNIFLFIPNSMVVCFMNNGIICRKRTLFHLVLSHNINMVGGNSI